jgi:hypothetical protein
MKIDQKRILIRMTLALVVVAAMGLVFFLPGRAPGQMTEEALMAYIRDPGYGLYRKESRGGFEISAMYKPTDLLVAQELGGAMPSPEQVTGLRKRYGAFCYFVVGLAKDGQDALYASSDHYAEFSDQLQKLSFRLQDFIYMTTSSDDTCQLLDYHFSRMHGMGGSTQVLLAFDRPTMADADWVQLNLKEMGFGTGRVNLRFGMKDMLRAPSIDFYKKNSGDQ